MSTETTFLPWHQNAFLQLQEQAHAKRLAHAWLFSGPEGIGKLAFARHLAKYLLCRAPVGNMPCGACNDCHYFSAGTHPDWRLLQPEKKLITIDQIRESIEYASNKSQRGGYQILCVYPAEAMNNNAANALLKLLEEPPPQTILLLVSHQPGMLLATLRSRCQHLQLPTPDLDEARRWLEAQGFTGDAAGLLQKAHGAPLRALAMSDTGLIAEHETILANLQDLLAGSSSPVAAARKCEKISVAATIEFLMQSVATLLKALQTNGPLVDGDLQGLQRLLPEGNKPRERQMALHALYVFLGNTRKVAMASNNPNPLLILEQVFGEWSKLRRLSHTDKTPRR